MELFVQDLWHLATQNWMTLTGAIFVCSLLYLIVGAVMVGLAWRLDYYQYKVVKPIPWNEPGTWIWLVLWSICFVAWLLVVSVVGFSFGLMFIADKVAGVESHSEPEKKS